MAQTPTRARASAAGTEARLHAASVQAGAGAAIDVTLHTLPLLRPFIPKRLLDAADAMKPAAVRRELVRTIYRRHGLKPAGWEIESVLAVAETQAKLSRLTRKDGLRDLMREWLPAPLLRPLLRWTPLQPLLEETVRAVATTWAAGRYADAVCRVRHAGMDWLPTPLGEALDIAPGKLREFSAEALTLALPPLKLAAAWGGQVLRASGRIAKAAGNAAARPAPVRRPTTARTTSTAKAKPKPVVARSPERKRPAQGRASTAKRR
jgi:hypothetical protein